MTNAVGGVDSTQAFAATSATSFRERMQQAMQPVADKLGMSEDDLQSELKSGKSLSDVANDKGVSHDDLVAAIKQGLQSVDSHGDSDGDTSTSGTDASTDSSKLDTMANRIADHKHGGHHHHHGGGGTADATDSTSSSSGALGLLQQAGFDPQELLQQLQNGAISSDTADKFGISAQSYASLLNGQQVDVQA
jgi:hypothetical protein